VQKGAFKAKRRGKTKKEKDHSSLLGTFYSKKTGVGKKVLERREK